MVACRRPAIWVALVVSSFRANEAVTMRNRAMLKEMTLTDSLMRVESSKSLMRTREVSKSEMMSTMTVEKAYDIFAKMNATKQHPELVALVQEQFSHSSKKDLPPAYQAVEKARIMLNGMMETAMEKKDISSVDCGEFEVKQLAILKDLELDIAYVNSEAAAARSEVLRSQEVIQVVEETKLPTTRQQLVDHNERCRIDVNSLKAQLAIVVSDVEVMKRILRMICADDLRTPLPGGGQQRRGRYPEPSFLQTEIMTNEGTITKCVACTTGKQFAYLKHHQLEAMLGKLKSNVAKSTLQSSLLDAFDYNVVDKRTVLLSEKEKRHVLSENKQNNPFDEMPPRPPPQKCNEEMIGENGTLYRGCQDETGSGKRCQAWDTQNPHEHPETSEMFPQSDLQGNNYCRNPGGKNTIWCYTTDQKTEWEYCAPKQELEVPTGVSKHECIETNACKLGAAQCKILRDRFLFITAGLVDYRNKLSDDLALLEQECEDTKISFENIISVLESQLKEEQTNLAGATKAMTENQQLSTQSNSQHQKLDGEYHEYMTECCDTKNELTAEVCALEKIRGELFKMEGIEILITDCEVSGWVDEECTVSCGGGTQVRERSIIIHPANGTVCPVLQMARSCNMRGCPVDCQVDVWSQWSECTAECGGGVRTRSRARTVEADNDGEPCPELTESVDCNIDACNANCELHEWNDWGLCSKACDVGHETRVRETKVPERGNGQCAPLESETRMEHRECNEFPCEVLLPQNRSTLRCDAMIDMIIALDGSGSLQEYGWQEFKSTAENLVASMEGNTTGVNLAFMLFGGPDNADDLENCTSSNPNAQPDIENQCGIKWVHPFSTDIPAVLESVQQMTWPATTTLTSMAIAEARAMLINGRPEASSVVVVITDGKPMSPIKTGRACEDLKKESRLVFIPVGDAAQDAIENMRMWASKPSEDNVIPITAFASMDTFATLNNVIAGICPNVV